MSIWRHEVWPNKRHIISPLRSQHNSSYVGYSWVTSDHLHVFYLVTKIWFSEISFSTRRVHLGGGISWDIVSEVAREVIWQWHEIFFIMFLIIFHQKSYEGSVRGWLLDVCMIIAILVFKNILTQKFVFYKRF